MPNPKRFETQWGGKTLTIEVGKYANQAGGSCTVQYGDTVVLATAVMSSEVREGLNFFPLQVEFEERLYAAGRIKGSRFMKKEGRPTDEAILTARFIDRAIRPLFDDRMRNEIQVVVTTLVFDGINDPDVLGLIGASCALHISEIPWNGPIGCIRIGQVEGEWVINPSYEAREKSILDLSFAGTDKMVIMVEAGAKEAPEETILEAFTFGQKHLSAPVKLIEEVRAYAGKEKVNPFVLDTEEKKTAEAEKQKVRDLVTPFIAEQVKQLFYSTPQATKSDRTKQKDELKKRTKAFLKEQGIEETLFGAGMEMVSVVLDHEVARFIIEEDKRVDGRGNDEIRNLFSEVSVLPRVHGSGHFMRGETQVLSVVTLGAPGDEQTLDGMELVGKKRYFHHYNFPPFSVGECKPMRGPSRRDIGHGGLAEKALEPMLPDKESFPYTIRVVSEVFGSNGSSSMGSTCGSTLALMDAGVPIKAPVAGIAIGLASLGNKWKVITDLQDLEDGAGGMDFKIAGSKTGITAIQMDTKTEGLTKEIVEEAIMRAKSARLRILDQMQTAIAEPRADLSPYAPRIISMRINPERIGDVIGTGGKIINEIIATTGVTTIDIEDDGLVLITSMNAEGALKAKETIFNLTREIVAGEIFKGKVTRIMDFGAIVEFMPKKDGMVHVSEMAPYRVDSVTDIVKMGDEVFVKVLEVSEGRTSLSMKSAPGNVFPEKKPSAPRPEGQRDSRPSSGRPSGPPRPRAPFVPRSTPKNDS